MSNSLSQNSVSYDSAVSGESVFEDDPLSSTTDLLRDMFLTNRGTDVLFTFKTEGKFSNITHRAHRLILTIWSPYFAKYFFENNLNPEEEEIVLEDTDPDSFYFMLRFMYDDSPPIGTCEKAQEIYKVAVKFQVHQLIKDCLIFVKNYESQVSDVFYHLDAALNMNLKSTIQSCVQLIQGSTLEVLESCEPLKVTPAVIHVVLNLSSFSLLSYCVLLEWVLNWAQKQSVKSSEDICFILKEFLSELSFLSLSSTEFVKLYSKHKQQGNEILDTEEAFNVLMNIITPNSAPLPNWLCKETVYESSFDEIKKVPYAYSGDNESESSNVL